MLLRAADFFKMIVSHLLLDLQAASYTDWKFRAIIQSAAVILDFPNIIGIEDDSFVDRKKSRIMACQTKKLPGRHAAS